MATNAFTLKTETPPNTHLLIKLVALLGIFAVSGLFFAVNYWLAVIIFFFGLLLWTYFSVPEYQGRNLWLLLLFSLFVAVIAGSLAQLLLSNNPTLVRQWAQTSEVAAALLGDEDSILLTSILVGLMAALVIVIIPFLLLIAIATTGILELHKRDEKISFWDAYQYLLTAVLGISYFAVTIENGQLKGSTKDKQRLEIFGGPGWLTVYPGQVVVLHRAGKITNVVGAGTTMLKPDERIKTIIPLTSKGGSNKIEHVLTRDKMPLTINTSYAAQIEPAAETKKRLEQAVEDAKKKLQEAKVAGQLAQDKVRDTVKSLQEARENLQHTQGLNPEAKENLQKAVDEAEQQFQEAKEAEKLAQDKINEIYKNLQEAKQHLQEITEDEMIGDEYDKCYKSIAKLVAAKVSTKADMNSDIGDAMKGSVTNNIIDVILSCKFEEIFDIKPDESDGTSPNGLNSNVNNRKIVEIEKLVQDKAGSSAPGGKGIVLRSVDINQIHYPDPIEETIVTEAAALTQARIKNIEAKTEEATARTRASTRKISILSESEAREAEAKSRLNVAEYEGRAIERRALSEAKAHYNKETAKARARVEYYDQIVKTLKENQQSPETIKAVLESAVASATLEDELKRLLEMIIYQVRGEQPPAKALSESSSSKQS